MEPPGPSVRRRTHPRYRTGSGSPPCCPQSRWPCISRTPMGRSPVGEGSAGSHGGPVTLCSSAPLARLDSNSRGGAPGWRLPLPAQDAGAPGSRLEARGDGRPSPPGAQARLPTAVRPPSLPRRPHLREGALAVHHKQRCLAAAAVAHDHDLQLLPARARARGPGGVHSREQPALAAARGRPRGLNNPGRGQRDPAPWVPAAPPPGSRPGPPPGLFSFPLGPWPAQFTFHSRGNRQPGSGGARSEARLPLSRLHVKARAPHRPDSIVSAAPPGHPRLAGPASWQTPSDWPARPPPSDRGPLIGGPLPQHQGSRSLRSPALGEAP